MSRYDVRREESSRASVEGVSQEIRALKVLSP
jgi:hypothetical protein